MAVSPKQRTSALKVKRGRPPKCKLLREKLPGLDKIIANQLVSHEKERAQCHKRKRATCDDLYENADLKSAVMERALEVQANLSSKFPSLIKYMLPSHVTGGFWLGLPRHFCLKFLPKEDRMMFLEDEDGKEFQTKYLVEKSGLSGGWRGFSIAHKLLEGDVCVFHLVNPSKFKGRLLDYLVEFFGLVRSRVVAAANLGLMLKAYIVRRNGSDEVNVALGLLKLESSTLQVNLGEEPKICGKTRDKPLENYQNRTSVEKTGKFLENISWQESIEQASKDVLVLDISEKSVQKNEPTVHSSNLGASANQPENDRVDLGSKVLDRFRLSERVVEFKEVKNFEDFNIIVDGLVIDSELVKHMQTKYYNLCCSQKSFLHENLLEGLNCKLVAGAIVETINIADAIRAAKLATSHHTFLIWDQTLKSFEGLGMKVGFLRDRLNKLMKISMRSRRYQEARLEQTNANEKRRKLEAKLVEVTKTLTRLDAEIGSLEEENADRLEIVFQEVASALW